MAVAPNLQPMSGAGPQGAAIRAGLHAGINARLDTGLNAGLNTGLDAETAPSPSIEGAEWSAGGNMVSVSLAPGDRWKATLSMAGVNRESSEATLPSAYTASVNPAPASPAGTPVTMAPVWRPMALPSAQAAAKLNGAHSAPSTAAAAFHSGNKADKPQHDAAAKHERKLKSEPSSTAQSAALSLHVAIAPQPAPFQQKPSIPASTKPSAAPVAHATPTGFSCAPVIGPLELAAPAASLSAAASGQPAPRAERPSASPPSTTVVGAVLSQAFGTLHTARVDGMEPGIDSSAGKEVTRQSQTGADSLHEPASSTAATEAGVAPSSAGGVAQRASLSSDKAAQLSAAPASGAKPTGGAPASGSPVRDAAFPSPVAGPPSSMAARPSASVHDSRQIGQLAALPNAIAGNHAQHAAGSGGVGIAPVTAESIPQLRPVLDTRQAVAGRTTTSGSMQTAFTAMDGAGPSGTAWVHTGARHAEAGFQDASLGWVSVRAEAAGGGIHATLAGVNTQAAQALSGHLAGLNAFLEERQTPVQSIHVMQPGLGEMGGGTNGSDQHGTQHQSGGQNDPAAGEAVALDGASRPGQVLMPAAPADLSLGAGPLVEGHVSWIA